MTDLSLLDRRSLFHPFTSIKEHLEEGPLIITGADGIRIVDDQGKSYIDAMAGLWCVNVGYGRSELIDAMTAQSKKLPYYHSFASSSNEPAIELAERLLAMAPGAPARVFFANSGSEANDRKIDPDGHGRLRVEVDWPAVARRSGFDPQWTW